MVKRFTAFYLVPALMVVFEVQGKSLIFNKYNSMPRYDARKQALDFDYEEIQGNDHLDNAFGYKRSVEEMMHPFKRNIFNMMKKRSPYGLVYNQGKPVGILEPIGQAFEYASYPTPREIGFNRNSGYKSQWFPTKRESDFELSEQGKEELEAQATSLHNRNYANVLAKFKVNNKVKQRPYQDFISAQQVKRDALPAPMTSLMSSAAVEEADSVAALSKKDSREDLKKREIIDFDDLDDHVIKIDPKAAKTKRKVEEKIDQIEENLKNVMDDMGLVEKESENSVQREDSKLNPSNLKKREIYFEDEDLENGLNKIGLTKESHYDRDKKEDCPGKTKIAKSFNHAKKTKVEKSIHKKKKKSKKESDERQRFVKSTKGGGFNKMPYFANYQEEGEEFIRKRRQSKDVDKDDNDIMKGLELSGDLTVSGNKSPLVAVSSEESEKKSQEKRDKEELEYEKRLERNIEAKINAIKEEVKREISRLQNEEAATPPNSENQRKKRETSNLMDEESSELDPGLNIEGKLEDHIRKRRNVEALSKRNEVIQSLVEENSLDNAPLLAKIEDSILNAEDENSIRKGDVSKTENAAIAKRSDFKSTEQPNEENGEPEEKPIDKRLAETEDDNKDSNEDDEEKIMAMMKKRNEKKANSDDDKEDKIIDKRSPAASTDKIENDSQANLITDAPKQIVKREDQPLKLTNKEKSDIDAVILDANNIVKRNEPISNEKTVQSAVESSKVTDEKREERSPDPKSTDLSTGQTPLKDTETENKLTKNLIPADEAINRAQRNAQEETSNKPIVKNDPKPEEKRSADDKLTEDKKIIKRSTPESKPAVAELDKPVASKSTILNDEAQQTDNKDNIQERSVKVDEKQSSEDRTERNALESSDDANLESEINEMESSRNIRSTDDGLDAKNLDQDELEVVQRRRRRAHFDDSRKGNSRRKRDNIWNNYQKNQENGYRADDGEIDDEDDEMQDDGFEDQTSNMVNKRNIDYDQSDDDLQDYPTYIERNKRNALRLYDDETEADESFDNFLFYPNRYSRPKRQNYEDDVSGVQNGGNKLMHHMAMTRNLQQDYDQRARRKRLEMMNRYRTEKNDVAALSEADIFGGLPQSYEGELSRFKRVKRSKEKPVDQQ